MTATATVVLSIIGTGIGVIGVLAAMLRILSTNVNRELQASTNRIDELKADPGGRIGDTNKRIDDTNKRIDSLTTAMHQRFDRVHQELGGSGHGGGNAASGGPDAH